MLFRFVQSLRGHLSHSQRLSRRSWLSDSVSTSRASSTGANSWKPVMEWASQRLDPEKQYVPTVFPCLKNQHFGGTSWIFSDTFAGDFEDGLNHPKLAETPNSMSSEGSHTEIGCKTGNLCRTLYTMSLCFLIIGWSLKCHPFLKHHLNYLGLGQIWVPKRCFVFHKKWTKIISTHSHLYLRVS